MERTKIGIIGCGNISGIYCKNGRSFNNLEITACADLDIARAQAKAAEYHLRKGCSVEELLADPEIEIVVNLTIPAAHAAISRQILEAGKHVYSEKPLAINREDGAALETLAREKNLRTGCAPDTFLGAGLQTCRQLLDQGAIGEPIGVSGWMLSNGPEGWHPDPEFFYQPGAGPMFDMGPYYLTAMTSLLGPVQRLTGSARVSFPQRTIGSQPKFGQKIDVKTATHIAAVLDFASGVVGTLVTSFDVHGSTVPWLELYGSEGTLLIPDPNTFGGPVQIRRAGEKTFEDVPLTRPYTENSRGVGLADMAAAIRAGRPHRASGEMAFHVLDLMVSIHDASREGRHVQVGSTMQRPEALPPGLAAGDVELPS